MFEQSSISPELLLSAGSAILTGYFWLVRSRRETPRLTFYQLQDFRATLRSSRDEKKAKRLGLTQIEPCGVLVANNSTRQNSIVRFDCFLRHKGQQIRGSWGYVDDDQPPWNIAPESTISMRLACFFDVPENFEIPDNLRFRVEFVTASGKRFSHLFSRQAPAT